jgi:hypothetical protein
MVKFLRATRVHRLTSCAILFSFVALSRAEESGRASPLKLVVEVKVVELNLDKIRRLGFDWAQLAPDGGEKKYDIIQILNREVPAGEGFSGFLDALAKNGLARTLAEPTIVTLDGRPASFDMNGMTKLDIVPIVRGDGRVHFECRLEIREPVIEDDRIIEAKTTARPPIVKLDAANLLELGKCSLLSRARTKQTGSDGKTSEIETLVLVRVDKFESSRLAKLPVNDAGGVTVELKTSASPNPTR